jgi:hypothetical protein
VAAQFALIAWLIWPLTPQLWSLPALLLFAAAEVVAYDDIWKIACWLALALVLGDAGRARPARSLPRLFRVCQARASIHPGRVLTFEETGNLLALDSNRLKIRAIA